MSSIQTNTETTSTDTTENKEVAEDTVEDPSELK
jgi:hypothetical protein